MKHIRITKKPAVDSEYGIDNDLEYLAVTSTMGFIIEARGGVPVKIFNSECEILPDPDDEGDLSVPEGLYLVRGPKAWTVGVILHRRDKSLTRDQFTRVLNFADRVERHLCEVDEDLLNVEKRGAMSRSVAMDIMTLGDEPIRQPDMEGPVTLEGLSVKVSVSKIRYFEIVLEKVKADE